MSNRDTPLDLVGRLADRITNAEATKTSGPAAAAAPAALADRVAAQAETAAHVAPQPSPSITAPPPVAAPHDETRSRNQSAIEIDSVRLQKEGYLTPQNQRSLIAEEYRIIKRPLLRAAFDRSGASGHLNHVLMVTSAKPGEGKTYTAINLAMSVASERDLYVLLVDCDIRRMGLSSKLGIADRKGIMDVLLNPSLTVSDVMLKTNVPNLALIPSGQPVAEATELFASQSMAKLVDDIASRYPDRFIIFDAPPVLASSEPGVLAMHVGHVVFVVAAGETSKKAITESLTFINSCPNVHFVINRSRVVPGQDRFGYYGTY